VDNAPLAGKTALVTGGSRGLGRAIAFALADAGADLVLVARPSSELTAVAEDLRGRGHRCELAPADLGEAASVDALVTRLGRRESPVDVVIHAAGIQIRKGALELTVPEWDAVMTVNLRSAFFLSCGLVRSQASHPPTRHIFIASLTSSIGIAHTSAYAASKAAVLGTVRSLAVEWAGLGITVNAIQPGYFHTELTDAVFADPERRAWIEGRIPLGRVGVGDDLGGAAVFLASAAASYITGQAITVDGGWLAS
jgi:2-dehydro-3-deoxy-D-gluconate 5-dehydrogenase